MQRLEHIAAESVGTPDSTGLTTTTEGKQYQDQMDMDEDGLPELNWLEIAHMTTDKHKEVEKEFAEVTGDAFVEPIGGQTLDARKSESFCKKMKASAIRVNSTLEDKK